MAADSRGAPAVPVTESYDACVAGVGAPKDANPYQASRAATHVLLGDRNPVRPGGRVVVPARLDEGAGRGTGERRFGDRLRGATDADTLYETVRAGDEPGARRAFVLARALRDHELWVTNATTEAEAPLVRYADHVADAVESGSDVLVVPDGLDALLVEG